MVCSPQVIAFTGAEQVSELFVASLPLAQGAPPTVTVALRSKFAPLSVSVAAALLVTELGVTPLSTGGACGGGSLACHFAFTCRVLCSVTLQVGWIPVQAPVQPANIAPGPGTAVAVSSTIVPAAK